MANEPGVVESCYGGVPGEKGRVILEPMVALPPTDRLVPGLGMVHTPPLGGKWEAEPPGAKAVLDGIASGKGWTGISREGLANLEAVDGGGGKKEQVGTKEDERVERWAAVEDEERRTGKWVWRGKGSWLPLKGWRARLKTVGLWTRYKRAETSLALSYGKSKILKPALKARVDLRAEWLGKLEAAESEVSRGQVLPIHGGGFDLGEFKPEGEWTADLGEWMVYAANWCGFAEVDRKRAPAPGAEVWRIAVRTNPKLREELLSTLLRTAVAGSVKAGVAKVEKAVDTGLEALTEFEARAGEKA